MDIPLQAQVECNDGVCGTSAYVLVNPIIEQVTHLVVRESSSHTEYIVPVDLITANVDGTIRLNCNKAEMEKMDPFIQTRFIQERVPNYPSFGGYGMGSYYYWPYVKPNSVTVYEAVDDQRVPANEIAVQRGTRVEATDGYVGHVDELVINSDNGHITHLVMREGHLWGKKDVVIPLSALGESRGETVLLKLNKHQIDSLPSLPVHRLWA